MLSFMMSSSNQQDIASLDTKVFKSACLSCKHNKIWKYIAGTQSSV